MNNGSKAQCECLANTYGLTIIDKQTVDFEIREINGIEKFYIDLNMICDKCGNTFKGNVEIEFLNGRNIRKIY